MNTPVSIYLLSVFRRYNRQKKSNPDVVELMECHTLIPVCPEQTGDMTMSCLPSKCRGTQVVDRESEDVTVYYGRGAEQALKLVRLYHCEYAILKERNPSCDKGHIYDGTFTGTLVPGDGAAAVLPTEHRIKVIGEGRIPQIFGNDKEGNSDELEEK